MEQLDWVVLAMNRLVQELSHAMCTKMATLQMKQQGLEKLWPKVAEGYHLAIENRLIENQNSDKLIDKIECAQNLNEQLIPMFQFLETLNGYFNHMVSHKGKDVEKITIQACLSNLLLTYPFSSNIQRQSIRIEINNDFELNCPVFFVEAALYHFLTQALKLSDPAKQEIMHIFNYDEGDYHILSIKVNSSFSKTTEFEHILWEPYDKSRPGLGFCRIAMLYFGGDFIFEAGVDEPTHYKMFFPKSNLFI